MRVAISLFVILLLSFFVEGQPASASRHAMIPID